MQTAGDVIFIPTAWAHAVLNIEDVVATAIEFLKPETHVEKSPPKKLKKRTKKKKKKKKKTKAKTEL